jgi:hypothetical protein
MSLTAAPAPLAPDVEARLVELARAFRAAARAVAFYPPGHPAITATLLQIVDAAGRATAGGALTLTVLPTTLLVARRAPSRADAAIVELAALLHRHAIGTMRLHGASDEESWHRFLTLLARAPEEIRADRGIRHLWSVAGDSSIEVEEINYADMLRGRIGGEESSDLASLMNHYLDGAVVLTLEDAAVQALEAIVRDAAGAPATPSGSGSGAAPEGAAGPAPVKAQVAAILRLLRGLAEVTAQTQPERFDEIFRKAAEIGARLSAEAMVSFVRHRNTPEAMAGDVDVVAALVSRMDDTTVAAFFANAMIEEGGASARLAEAFGTLVPDEDRRRTVLSIAAGRLERSPLMVEEGFLDAWEKVERVLESYSDRAYVSDAYARELSAARSRAVDVEQCTDDPAGRVAAWLATIDNSELRKLDQQLLLDLLSVETDPFRWREMLDTIAAHVEDLARVGCLDEAAQLVEAIAKESDRTAAHVFRRPFAVEALQKLSRSALTRHALQELREGDEGRSAVVARLCHALGPAVVGVLAETWSTERDARTRGRLRDIVIGFGARGRESVQQLMSAADWEVRRAAVHLLREFGGADDLPALEVLLEDADPRVRRDAFESLAFWGGPQGHELLLKRLGSPDSRVRKATIDELSRLRDARAVPLLCHAVTTLEPGRAPGLYLSAIDALGRFGGPDAVGALRVALHRGEWWAPVRTRSCRAAAAAALRAIRTPEAHEALRSASSQGARGVRAAARRELLKAGGAR